jgi:hypothetical protein
MSRPEPDLSSTSARPARRPFGSLVDVSRLSDMPVCSGQVGQIKQRMEKINSRQIFPEKAKETLLGEIAKHPNAPKGTWRVGKS